MSKTGERAVKAAKQAADMSSSTFPCPYCGSKISNVTRATHFMTCEALAKTNED